MRLPKISGVIDRRILANFRIAPECVKKHLPLPFRPQLCNGWAVGGICLIRLTKIRPDFIPLSIGIRSENAAHRIAVEWDEDGKERQGVFIPRRDTVSWLNAMAGGRAFPGIHHRAKFSVSERGDSISVSMKSIDELTSVHVSGRIEDELPPSSLFASLSEASDFFQKDSLGFSNTKAPGIYDGIELSCRNWSVKPLKVNEVSSSYFEDPEYFPDGSVEFDCALLMRGIDHQWIGRDQLCCPSEGS